MTDRRLLPLLRTLALALTVCVGCDKSNPPSAPQSNGPTASPTTAQTDVPVSEIQRKVTMEIGGKPFTLEVAATEADRERGLMYRKSMADDHGMIFVFPAERPLSFWMKNTLIPLDIVYLDRAGKIVNVSQMKPLDETGVPSGWPAKYAVELNVGTADKLGVKAGQFLRVPAEARETRE